MGNFQSHLVCYAPKNLIFEFYLSIYNPWINKPQKLLPDVNSSPNFLFTINSFNEWPTIQVLINKNIEDLFLSIVKSIDT